MSEDSLEIKDTEHIVLTGKIAHRFTHDLRGTRYEIIGDTTDGRRAYAVCRFLPSDILLIITAYIQDERR